MSLDDFYGAEEYIYRLPRGMKQRPLEQLLEIILDKEDPSRLGFCILADR